jgi:hypothetical protein
VLDLYLDANDKEQQQWTCEAPGERPWSKSTAPRTAINVEFEETDEALPGKAGWVRGGGDTLRVWDERALE